MAKEQPQADRPRQAPPAPGAVLAFARSVGATARMLAGGRLVWPRERVGLRLRFADGTSSTVFRETAVRDVESEAPSLLVVQFKLWHLGRVGILHAAFRRGCIVNTPLFAGFPGFRSKLWAADLTTWVYRGVYEWDGADQAVSYAETLLWLLRPFSNRGTLRYHVVPGVHRDEVLGEPKSLEGAAGPGDAWWQIDAARSPAEAAAP